MLLPRIWLLRLPRAPSARPRFPFRASPQRLVSAAFNKFNHAWNSIQLYDDAFYTHGTHAIKFGFAFERMQYNILEQLSPNGRMNGYSLAAFLTNAPHQLNALAPGGSFEVGLRESLFAGYIQDDWRFRPNLTFNIGLRYEATTRPTASHNVPRLHRQRLHSSHRWIPADSDASQLHSGHNCLRPCRNQQSDFQQPHNIEL